MEQMRDFDFVQGAHDVLVAIAGLSADITSGLPYTVLGGLVGSQTVSPSLSVNISSGRIYQLAASDLTATGSIPQDLTVIAQQGFAAAQTLTLIAPSSGQSQWNLVQAQFSQVDAVRTNDPNGGIVPFYNAANPTQPTLNSINTVRKGVCVLQVISGSAATTGSEAPPTPTGGWVPLYLIDLAGGQTQITTSQIITSGPSVGTGVSNSYPVAPFLAGLLASHHSGAAGQAPKIKLGSEVQGILPYANMSAVRTLLNGNLTLYVNTTGADTNTGLNPSIPFKTMQAAVNAGTRNYDFNGNTLTISVANGTYSVTQVAGGVAVSVTAMPLGCSAFNIVGNIASPGSVVLSVNAGVGINVTNAVSVNLGGLTITVAGSTVGFNLPSGYGLNVGEGSLCTLTNMAFGSCGTIQVQAAVGGFVIINGPVSCTGTTGLSFQALYSGTLYNTSGATITVTGLTCSTAFAGASQGGSVVWFGGAFVGSVTGTKYSATLNGTINTAAAGVNFFPGSVAGTTSTGGQYA